MSKRSRTTLAIITKRSDFSETSRILQMCTRDFGRLGFLAKGAHRHKSPFLGAVDLFHVVEAKVQVSRARGLQTVHSLRVVQGNRPFRRDPLRFLLACHYAELIRVAMPEGREDVELFDLFHGALRLFGRVDRAQLPTVDAGVRLRLLSALGVLPNADECPVTGKALPRSGQVLFSPAEGGFLHPSLAEKRGKGRLIPARLPGLTAEILDLEGRELATKRAPKRPLAALRPLITDLIDWQFGDAPKLRCPEKLLAGL